MEVEELKAKIEAILYCLPDGITTKKLATTLGIGSTGHVKVVLAELKKDYEALDMYYTSLISKETEKKALSSYEKKLKSLEHRLKTQLETLQKYAKEHEKLKEFGDYIYANYEKVSKLLKQGKKVELKKDLILTPLKSLAQNANVYYEKAKKLKKKLPGLKKSIAESEKKLKELKKKVPVLEIKKPKLIVTKKKKWYEKFHWFFTSSGFLAVGGKDATSNEIIIKKHVDKGELIFHTEAPGSPFFVIKSKGKKVPKKDLEEVAQATVSYSRAWRMGLGSTDAYYVTPEQVSKKAESGEYLSKGAFMIRGKKNYFRNVVLGLSVGITDKGEILSGPKGAIKEKCMKIVDVKTGWDKKSDIAKKIMNKLGVKNKLDEIISGLPAGKSSIA